MTEFFKQIYPHIDNEAPVKYSGVPRYPKFERQDMDPDTWAKLPTAVKYQVGLAGLMLRDPSIEIFTFTGGVYNAQQDTPYFRHEEIILKRKVTSIFFLKGDSVYQRIVSTMNDLASDNISFQTDFGLVGIYPVVLAVTPRDTSLQFITVTDTNSRK